MREILLVELFKEILGPRDGIEETLNSPPISEYITGVLAPITDQIVREIDQEAEMPYEDTDFYDEETDMDIVCPPLVSPALYPQNRPPSVGISFEVESSDIPKIDICLTWARYIFNPPATWTRAPRKSIFTVDLNSNQRFDFNGDEERVARDQGEISLHIIVRQRDKNRHFISLYLVNRLRIGEDDHSTSAYHIFQPQIRILCHNGSRIMPEIRNFGTNEEEQILEFLYRNRPVLARGHFCSSIWRSIDPENSPPSNLELDFPDCCNKPPFKWLDGEKLSPEDRERFSPPDLRTEFVPIYSIPFPQLNWSDTSGVNPEFRAGILAEKWNSEDLRNSLLPLADGYERWIEGLENRVDSSLPQNNINNRLIQECRTVLGRIRSGIDILYHNDEVRLAFCFANKAMDIQSIWSQRRTGLIWFPFQLAYILMTLESIANPQSSFRNICDLLWVPTGTGKTEAYLAITAFTIAYRRRMALLRRDRDSTGAGVSVISRYTLRLLTIQQFRRALALITACEYLRIFNFIHRNNIGWRPQDYPSSLSFLWGSTPFSIGLWVGGQVTPNRLTDTWSPGSGEGNERRGGHPILGAISILRGQTGEGEPAQVLNCPACGTILAIPDKGLPPNHYTLFFVIHIQNSQNLIPAISNLIGQNYHDIQITNVNSVQHISSEYYTLIFEVESTYTIEARNVDMLWDDIRTFLRRNDCNLELIPVRASRLGYFLRYYITENNTRSDYDFEIFCPNPNCPLHQSWCGGAPVGWVNGEVPRPLASCRLPNIPYLEDRNRFIHVQGAFRNNSVYISDRIPIMGFTVDSQIYQRLPSIVVATVDKFARPPFEPRAASLFGNVDHYHCIWGYYRRFQRHYHGENDGHPTPIGRTDRNFLQIIPPDPPNLILQDELHLVEGPLGSLVGLYETAIDFLCREVTENPIKYIASTATIRRAEQQVRAVFSRGLQLFPPHGTIINDRFFLREIETHPLDDKQPGRLYTGVCAPGRGPHTPFIRISSSLLQTVYQNRTHPEIDMFWTLTSYFNAVRDLGGARALYRQDIPQRINESSGTNARDIQDENGLELSSRTPSTELPSILDILSRPYPNAPDALFTTSMFGTGIDISRLGLMIVSGQPKTTSSYIQSTGRVGRRKGALVITFYRATRPRDLNHYEFFCGYHAQLHRFVEPVTVYPFSPGALQRATGAVGVFILRNMRNTRNLWHTEESAPSMADLRTNSLEVQNLSNIMENRSQIQPLICRALPSVVEDFTNSELDSWHSTAMNHRDNLLYVEYAFENPPQSPVVLGDFQHQHQEIEVVYENVPQSLRDIEETTGFEI